MNNASNKRPPTNNDFSLGQKSIRKPSSLSKCIDQIKIDWRKEKNLAALWQDWPKIAGKNLSSNCTLLNLERGILTIGTNHPQWIQALIFNRNQLITALRAEGHEIKDLRIQQHYYSTKISKEDEQNIWENHPCRADIHGQINCPICKSPSPAGEVNLWGKCVICRRKELSK